MGEFLASYGLFIAKTITILIFFIIVLGLLASSRRKPEGGELSINHLNEKYTQMKQALHSVMLDKKQFKQLAKQHKKEQKEAVKEDKKRLFVIDFEGDVKATAVASLRDEVTAILTAAIEGDEVLVRLNNSGGIVHEHGLAASQSVRFKDAGIPLTVAVDKVAASGGYMMACVADKVLAAPFAIVGSIGVIAQLPNFNRLLDKAGVDFEQHTAGEYKRNVTMFGKNTKKEREQLKEQLEGIHDLFRDFVIKYRPDLDMTKVGTGEYWYGSKALELGLVDELLISDDYLLKCVEAKEVYQVSMAMKKSVVEKLVKGGASLYEQLIDVITSRSNNTH